MTRAREGVKERGSGLRNCLNYRSEGQDSIKDVAIYFRRDSSRFSRQIGNIGAKEMNSDELRERLSRYINAITQA